MAMDTLLVFAASYESVDDAVADYEASATSGRRRLSATPTTPPL